jgi:hypothetical protein
MLTIFRPRDEPVRRFAFRRGRLPPIWDFSSRWGGFVRRSLPVPVVALGLLAVGCSSGSGSSTQSSATSTSGSAAPSPAKPAIRVLTGAQLKALLAPVAWFPPGFALNPSDSVDTGDDMPVLPPEKNPPCSRLNATGWVELAGVTAFSFAQNDVVNPKGGQYAQQISVFESKSARQVMTGLRAVAARCPTFPDDQARGKVTVSVVPGPRVGDDALTLRLRDPAWEGGTTLEAIRVGDAVITAFNVSGTGTGQAEATKLATYLTGKVQVAQSVSTSK